MRDFITQLSRLRFEIVVTAACLAAVAVVGISQANFEVVVFKFLIFCPAVSLVHLSRRVLWGYVDLSAAIFGEGRFKGLPASIRAAVVIGLFWWYGIAVYALTQAI